jgi:flavin-dependent dehydrogenase
MASSLAPDSTRDCVIIGGGPAGATAATLLAGFGHRVLLLEKGRFPRHHIGESLMPQTYFTFQRLGVLDRLRDSAYPRKESVQFVSASGKESQPFYFTDRDPGEWSTTWQVRRDDFDKMMLDNARAHGAEVREGVVVKRVLFDGDRAVGVRVVEDGGARDITAKVVVDASGQSAILGKQLDLRYPDARLKNASVYAYFTGTRRDEGRNAGATIIIHTADRDGWFWYIPLPDDVASVGLVAPPSYLFSGRGDDPLATLREELAACPGMAGRMDGAECVSRAYVTSDFSYRSRRMAGDGWVLIGDAFGFLDPVYSSGVMLALKSGECAADAIHEGLESGDLSGRRLGAFGPKIVAGMHLIRQLVYAFYTKAFSFADFSRRHPEYHDHLVRILIGDVFNDEVGEMFEAMRGAVDLPEPIELEEDHR